MPPPPPRPSSGLARNIFAAHPMIHFVPNLLAPVLRYQHLAKGLGYLSSSISSTRSKVVILLKVPDFIFP